MMEIADEITIPAPRAAVYEALNDIAILKACIPGCESLERESDTKLVAKALATSLVSDSRSSDSHPGIQALRIAISFNAS